MCAGTFELSAGTLLFLFSHFVGGTGMDWVGQARGAVCVVVALGGVFCGIGLEFSGIGLKIGDGGIGMMVCIGLLCGVTAARCCCDGGIICGIGL